MGAFNSYFTILVSASCIQAANILFLGGIPSRSHHFWNRAIYDELAGRGHNITILSTDSESAASPNLNYLLLNGVYESIRGAFSKTVFIDNARGESSALFDAIKFRSSSFELCNYYTSTDGYQQLLNYPDSFPFDLILYDYTRGPCLLPFMHKFGYPTLIAISAFNMPSITTEIVGGHQFYAYKPHFAYRVVSDDMNFFNRAYNMAIHVCEVVYYRNILIPKLTELSRPFFGSDLPSLSDLERKSVLAMINVNTELDRLMPLPQNVIPVGGLHIKEPRPLPFEIESFIDGSPKGAILFCLGSNIQSEQMPAEKLNEFLEAFRQLPEYRFLWRYNDTNMKNIPENVLLRPWLPQTDILAHRKTKGFITHAGLLSIQESVWHAVPMLAIPFAFDQHQNALRIHSLGIAELIDFKSFNAQEIQSKLSKILEDHSYGTEIRTLSTTFHDQKEKPLDRAVWWIEWAIRNTNASQFQSPTHRLGHVKANCYDVVSIGCVCLISAIFLLWKLALYAMRLAAAQNTKKSIRLKSD